MALYGPVILFSDMVSRHPATGRVLIYEDPGRHEALHTQFDAHAELLALRPLALSEVDELAAPIEAEAAFLASHSEIVRRMIDVITQIDAGMKRATHNTVDVKWLLPLGRALCVCRSGDGGIDAPLGHTGQLLVQCVRRAAPPAAEHPGSMRL